MTKRFTVNLDEKTYYELKKSAEQNYRSLSKEAEKHIKEGLNRNKVL